jgi:all-trans-retinol 13,14-reductase
MKKYDAVIIGSGISGLTAALILGQYGKRVALLEQFSNIAPLLRRFKRTDIWCDPGFHYTGGLGSGGTLSVLLKCLGVFDEIEPIPLSPEGFDIISVNGEKEYSMPYGYDRLAEYLCSRFPASSAAIGIYINALIKINNETAFTNLDLDLDQFSVSVYENQSLKEFLTHAGAESELISLLGNHGYVLYGSPADEVPMPVHAYIMGSFYNSSHTVQNGGDAFVKAFEKALRNYNIDILTNCKVQKIEINQKRAVEGIRTEDEQYIECDTCICTIHPKQLLKLLPASGVRPAYINRIRNLENTTGSLVVFIDSDYYPEKLQKTNFYRFNEKNNNQEDRDYLACMAAHPDTEPKGRRSLTIIKPAKVETYKDFFGESYFKNYDSYTNLKREETDKLFNEFLNIFPEMKSHARIVDSATPVTYNRYTRTDMGAMYGTKQSVYKRPLSSRSSIHGLYLAGQSLQLGVMGAIVSGFVATTHLIDQKVLREQIRKCH